MLRRGRCCALCVGLLVGPQLRSHGNCPTLIFYITSTEGQRRASKHLFIMKKIMLSFLLLSVATISFGQNVPSYVPTNGLVGWWPFNGNANDESGNGNNGTVIGTITSSFDRFGNQFSSYNFTGNGYIQLTNINLPSFTINAWVKRSGGGTSVVSKHYSASFNSSYILYAQESDFCIPRIYYTNTNNVAVATSATSTTLCDSQWHMLTATLNTSSLNIYVDGILISTANGGIAKSTTYNTLVGCAYTAAGLISNSDGLQGEIDDLGIWNRDLTQQEITNLYNGNICYQTISVTDTLYINTNITGYNPVTYENSIRIWPNPTNDHITIDAGNLNAMNGYSIRITNSLGQQMFQSAINQQQFYLDLATWTGNGMYYVNIIDPNGNIIDIKKIVLQ
jgi:hypothetical protein